MIYWMSLLPRTPCHPDRWAKRGERERILAERLSSKVNEVYRTLQSPIQRAQYLLQEHGLDIQEQEPPLEDAEALMGIMETMEEIDTSDDVLRLERLRVENDARISSTISELETAFENKDFTGAKAHLIRLIYWERIDRSLRKKLDS
ncbi:hypothetical protein FRB99_000198 [Tulasnella sp. 403]|nr:hypothetical protein FRB99_000198 [Tulasnella sp. 403]